MVARTYLLLVLGLGLGLGAAELEVDLTGAVIAGELLQLTVELDGVTSAPVDIQLPEAEGITWLGKRQTLRGSSTINGEISYRARWAVQAALDERERWTLPALTAVLRDGSRVSSQPRELTPTVVDERLRGDFFCAVGFEPEVVVPGQTTELVYEIFLRRTQRIDLDGGIGAELPEGAIELGEPRQAGSDLAFDTMGDPWTRVEFRLPFTMTEPGEYRVGGQQGFTQRLRPVATVPIQPGTLTVTSLPTEGRPEDFDGLIGPLAIAAELERDAIALGEGTTLSVTVRGRQLELLGKLPPPEVDGLRIRAVDDEATEDGSHRFDYNIQPERVGTYAVQPPGLSYFDPESRRYRRAEGPTLHLEVLPGRQRDLAIVGIQRPDGDEEGDDVTEVGFPPPLRGSGGARPAPRWGWLMLVVGATVGVVIGLASRLAGRIGGGPSLGTELARALHAADLEAIDRLLHRAQGSAAAPLQPRISAAIAAVERARFGGGTLDDAARQDLATLAEGLG